MPKGNGREGNNPHTGVGSSGNQERNHKAMSIIDTTSDTTVTDTITTDNIATTNEEPEQVTAAQAAEARVVHIDPHELIVEDNIRQEVSLPRSFISSIRQHGVIVPILAHPDVDGNIVVRDGQRRVLAAREAEQTEEAENTVSSDGEEETAAVA